MKQDLLKHYSTLVHFLGDTLGPDYRILLYDLENNKNSLIESSSENTANYTSVQKVPKDVLNFLSDDAFSKKDYYTNLPGLRNSISVNRNSYLIIKDNDGSLHGLLCVVFDDTRFTKLHDYLLSVAHPLDFVKNHSFHTIHNMEMYETTSEEPPSQESNLQNLMQTTYRDAILKANVHADRPNQEERMIVIKYLKEYGFFRLKGAVPYAAKHLGCSTASIYRYLSDLKE